MMEYNWSEQSTTKRMKRRRPSQRVSLNQQEDIGYLFANYKYYSVIKDNAMVSDLPPWYKVLAPGTITAFKTIRALLRSKIPMETDFSTIYRLMRTVCSTVTFDEVIDAMIVFFGPPRQTFEEFLLGFALRKWDNNAERRLSARQCIFYSAITFFTIETFERNLKNPIPPLTIKQIPPVLYWVLNQSVKKPADIVEAFTRLLLAAKSPYVRPMPNNSLISFIKLDQATRKFDWCDCKKKAVKYDYLHTKNAHKDLIWLTEEGPYLPQPKFIGKQQNFQKILQREKEKVMIPFSHPKPSLFKRQGKIIDLSKAPDYSPLVQRAKRIYETKLNKNFERSAFHFWNKYYKGRTGRSSEGRLFEVFKNYHQTQFCPRKRDKIKDIYTRTKFMPMADCYEYAEVFEDPKICSHFCCHPCLDYCSSVSTQYTCLEHQSNCPDLEQFSVQEGYDEFTDELENEDSDTVFDGMSNEIRDVYDENFNDIDRTNDNDNENVTNNDNTNDKDNDNKEPVNDQSNDNKELVNDQGNDKGLVNDQGNDKGLVNDQVNDNKEPVNEQGNDSVDGSVVSDKKDIESSNI